MLLPLELEETQIVASERLGEPHPVAKPGEDRLAKGEIVQLRQHARSVGEAASTPSTPD
jgi:hypothetical protein